MNKEVNFEIAKLLTEKGFDEPSDYYYNENGDLFLHITFTEKEDDWTIKAPTIAEVVMWLYEKHRVWINVDVDINGKFRHIVRKYNSNDRAWEVRKSFTISEYCNSPTEAYELAIKYTLENKIQGGNK